MIERRDGCQSCSAVAFLSDTLGASGMNEIAKVLSEPRFSCSLCFDSGYPCRDFNVVMQSPVLEVCRRLVLEDLGRDKTRDCCGPYSCGSPILQIPQQESFYRRASKDGCALPFAVR